MGHTLTAAYLGLAHKNTEEDHTIRTCVCHKSVYTL